MKFKAKAKDCQLSVKVKASFGEVIDDRELDRFRRVFLRGFLKPKMIKETLWHTQARYVSVFMIASKSQ